MFKKKNNRGFLLIEVVIVVTIIAVAILASMSAAQKSKQLSDRSVHVAQANFLLAEGAEIVRILRDSAWSNISSLNHNTDYYFSLVNNSWSLTINNSEELGRFNRKVVISEVYRNALSGQIASSGNLDPGTKLISVLVSWTEGGQSITKKLQFYLSNIFYNV